MKSVGNIGTFKQVERVENDETNAPINLNDLQIEQRSTDKTTNLFNTRVLIEESDESDDTFYMSRLYARRAQIRNQQKTVKTEEKKL